MYNVGDRVIYSPKLIKAKIIYVHPGTCEYTVEFEDPQLIPPQMKVPASMLGFEDRGVSEWAKAALDSLHKKDKCPRCGDKWKETWIGKDFYYDCLKCNLKKEDA